MFKQYNLRYQTHLRQNKLEIFWNIFLVLPNMLEGKVNFYSISKKRTRLENYNLQKCW